MKNFVQNGDFIEFAAVAAIASGDMVTVGDMVGISQGKYAIGETAVISLNGVYLVPKVTGAAIALGAKVYNDGTGKATVTVGTNKILGYSFSDELAAATTVRVKLVQ